MDYNYITHFLSYETYVILYLVLHFAECGNIELRIISLISGPRKPLKILLDFEQQNRVRPVRKLLSVLLDLSCVEERKTEKTNLVITRF